MKKEKRKKFTLIPFLLIFLALAAGVFSIAQRISTEMSQSAVNNLSDSLDLISGTIETILNKEAEFQSIIAQKTAESVEPEQFIKSCGSNSTMVKISLIMSGEESGISNNGDSFSSSELDFSNGKTVCGMPLSRSYVNEMGTWAYTMKCPVIRDGTEIAELYIEYIYDSFDDALPENFYNKSAKLYLMDSASERLVLKPKGMGERDAGHLNLSDFYYANKINESEIQSSVAENMQSGRDVMFYHNILNKESLIYMWSVNDGAVFLIGYVPVEAIQREGDAVNQNIAAVIIVMLIAFGACCILYFFFERQHRRMQREYDEERERYNEHLQEALKEAQIANRSKTTFLSSMSHDIRTPMNAILGFTALLENNADNPEKVHDYTRKIMSSGQHLLSLINDVLDISKIESGKVVLSIGEFDLRNVINSVEAIIRPSARDKNQHFEISVSGIEHERLIGDETRLNQILINLLSNAVKYTQEGGTINLRIIGTQNGECQHIRIEVEDNGYGMTPEFLETIFDSFTRAENSTTNKVQGTGLGMAITKNIVELMGGTIEVTSRMGEGSRFTVCLDFQPSEEVHEEDSAENSTETSIEGLHFLVVEDNEINSEILSELLSMEGATCEIAENGKIAVEEFMNAPSGHFNAVLMDVQMPVMNGYEATKAIRSLPRPDAVTIPIIAMTANAFAEDVKEALEAGMNAHVAKPIDMSLLCQTVGGLL